ncbi:DEAD/DEAH box helicase, partial [bacterium]|nr:DEAD/DEAH box helicase [bacterium]
MTSLLLIPNAMVPPSPSELPPPTEFAIQTKYALDPFQQHAVAGIHAGDHVFVTAKTGSGKTFVGEYLIAHCLRKGQRVFYTTPIKSLSNQKYHDLKKLFPDATVGIMTGDIKMCPHAQIIVMTAEILRNLLFKRGTLTESVGLTAELSMDHVGGIVMDEAHYIQDPDRGHVWEETLILLGPDPDKDRGQVPPQLVLLSATLPSAPTLAGWLANLHQKQTRLLETTYRIVPLVHGMLQWSGPAPGPASASTDITDLKVAPLLDSYGSWTDTYSRYFQAIKTAEQNVARFKRNLQLANREGLYKDTVVLGPGPGSGPKLESPTARLLRDIAWLRVTNNLPALFFLFSRRECERYAALVAERLLDSSDSAAVKHIIDFHLSRYRTQLEKSPQYHALTDLLVRGIGFHHSGLQPLLKE